MYDPNCGRMIDEQALAVSMQVGDRTLRFCSAQCLEQFMSYRGVAIGIAKEQEPDHGGTHPVGVPLGACAGAAAGATAGLVGGPVGVVVGTVAGGIIGGLVGHEVLDPQSTDEAEKEANSKLAPEAQRLTSWDREYGGMPGRSAPSRGHEVSHRRG